MIRQRKLFTEGRFEAFLEFHRANPQIYRLFLDLTLQMFRSGQNLGARCVWEQIRWRVNVKVQRTDVFRMNDHLVPYFARLVMLRYPELAGFFERRDARFDTDDFTLLTEANAIDSRRGIPTGRDG